MGMGRVYSQALVQTYVDRCTGAVSTFTVPMNGQTVVTFYNKSRVFTAQEFQDGTLQAWLESTYLWWTNLSPCSTTTTGAVATTNTTQQTTQNATTAATNAAQNTTSSAATQGTTNATSNATNNTTNNTTGNATSNSGSTSNGGTSQTNNTNSGSTNNNSSSSNSTSGGSNNGSSGSSNSGSGSTESGSTESGSNNSQDNSSSTETSNSSNENSDSSSSNEGGSEGGSDGGNEGDGSDVDNSSDDNSSDDNSSNEEGSDDNSSDENSDESNSEENNESTEEESSEESSEESTDEESDEGSEENEEETNDEEESESDEDEGDEDENNEEEGNNEDEEEDGKKKKKKRNLAPPIVTANVLSQQLPTGEYQQAINLGISQSSLLGDKTYALNGMFYSNGQTFMITGNYSKVHINKEGRVSRVYSGSLGIMKAYTTIVSMMNHSWTFLGKKGSVTGIAFGTTQTTTNFNFKWPFLNYDAQYLGFSLTGFYTKPFQINDRFTVTPMVATSSAFLQHDIWNKSTTWSKDLLFITGSNFTYNLTQRFGINVGANIIESTIKDFPTLKTFTIGGRLSF